MSLKIEKPEDLEEIAKYMTKAVKQPRDGFKNHDSWWDLKDLIGHFENDNGFDYKIRVKIWEKINGFEMPKTLENIRNLLTQIVKKNNKVKERKNRLLPAGIPRYIRCYDSGPDSTADRYTVVYTGNYKGKSKRWHDYVGISGAPFHPQGIGMHGQTEFQPVDRPTYSHLGKKIKFSDLPEDCKKLVMQDYLYYWDFTDENGKTI